MASTLLSPLIWHISTRVLVSNYLEMLCPLMQLQAPGITGSVDLGQWASILVAGDMAIAARASRIMKKQNWGFISSLQEGPRVINCEMANNLFYNYVEFKQHKQKVTIKIFFIKIKTIVGHKKDWKYSACLGMPNKISKMIDKMTPKMVLIIRKTYLSLHFQIWKFTLYIQLRNFVR